MASLRERPGLTYTKGTGTQAAGLSCGRAARPPPDWRAPPGWNTSRRPVLRARRPRSNERPALQCHSLLGAINRRELLNYLFFAVLILFAWFLLMMIIWFVTPVEPEVRLDLTAYPPSDVPYRIVREEGTFWLVHHRDEVLGRARSGLPFTTLAG